MTLPSAEIWGELRSLLHRHDLEPRTRQDWLNITQSIAKLPEAEQYTAALYAEKFIHESNHIWPAHVCSFSVNPRNRKLPPHFAAMLIKKLELTQLTELHTNFYEELLTLPKLSIAHLNLEAHRVKLSTLRTLLQATSLSHLTHLEFTSLSSHNKDTQHILCALLGSAFQTSLQDLTVKHLEQDALQSLALVLNQSSTISTLTIHEGVYPRDAWQSLFAQMTHNLESLTLSAVTNISDAIDLMIQTQHIDELQKLHMGVLNEDGLVLLSKANNHTLHDLKLSADALTEHSISALEGALFFDRLKHLQLTRSHAGPAQRYMNRLRESGLLAQLHTLNLSDTPLLEDGLHATLCEPLPSLRTLNLAHTGAGEHTLHHVMTCEMPRLERLNISGATLDSADIPRLGQHASARWPALKELILTLPHTHERDMHMELSEWLPEHVKLTSHPKEIGP